MLLMIIKEEKLGQRNSLGGSSSSTASRTASCATTASQYPVEEVAEAIAGSSSTTAVLSQIDTLLQNRFHDNKERYELYNVDFDIFKVLFAELTPWGRCTNVDLAEKLFRLMDKREVGYLDFEQVVLALGLICCGRSTEKLQLLYVLHLPPLLPRLEIEMKRQQQLKPAAGVDADMEEAAEAEHFFNDEPAESLDALPSPQELLQLTQPYLLSSAPSCSSGPGQSTFYVDWSATSSHNLESIDTISDISDVGPPTAQAARLRTTSSNYDDFSHLSTQSETTTTGCGGVQRGGLTNVSGSLSSLRMIFDQSTDADCGNWATHKSIPDMPQLQFIALWNTIVEIIGRFDTDVQEWYNQLVMVGYQRQQQKQQEAKTMVKLPIPSKATGASVESLTQMVINDDDESSSSRSSPPPPVDSRIAVDLDDEVTARKSGSVGSAERAESTLTKMTLSETTVRPTTQWYISYEEFLEPIPRSMDVELNKRTSVKDGVERMLKQRCIRSSV